MDMQNNTAKVNIDKKCAEYGFNICNYLNTIESRLKELLKEIRREKSSVNLVEVVEKLVEELDKIQKFNEFNNYVKTDECEKLKRQAERIQESNLSNREKIEKLLKACRGIVSASAKEYENAIRKALGILTSHGVFAFIIWVESNGGDKEYRAIKYQTSKFLSEIIKSKFSGNPDDLRDEIINVCDSIPQMFFVKQILEQMLTYALYRARSLR